MQSDLRTVMKPTLESIKADEANYNQIAGDLHLNPTDPLESQLVDAIIAFEGFVGAAILSKQCGTNTLHIASHAFVESLNLAFGKNIDYKAYRAAAKSRVDNKQLQETNHVPMPNM